MHYSGTLLYEIEQYVYTKAGDVILSLGKDTRASFDRVSMLKIVTWLWRLDGSTN